MVKIPRTRFFPLLLYILTFLFIVKLINLLFSVCTGCIHSGDFQWQYDFLLVVCNNDLYIAPFPRHCHFLADAAVKFIMPRTGRALKSKFGAAEWNARPVSAMNRCDTHVLL